MYRLTISADEHDPDLELPFHESDHDTLGDAVIAMCNEMFVCANNAPDGAIVCESVESIAGGGDVWYRDTSADIKIHASIVRD